MTHPTWCTRAPDEGSWHSSAPVVVEPRDGFQLTVTMRLVQHHDMRPGPYVEVQPRYEPLDGTEVEPEPVLVMGVGQAEVFGAELLALCARAVA